MGAVEMAVPTRKPASRARRGGRALVESSSPAASRPTDRARGFVLGVWGPPAGEADLICRGRLDPGGA